MEIRQVKKENAMIKMNDLVSKTNTPKSTISYYIKEGLLPPPYKDKPNFHLYDESCIKQLEFIKYLQSNFNASISQIKALFSQPNFDRKNPYESLIHSLSIITQADNKYIEQETLCNEFNISEQTLNNYIAQGLLNPREGIFTSREREILSIIHQCNETELNLLQTYIDMAKQLALFEVNIALEGLSHNEQKDNKLKHFFDILLVFKPYIFNMETLKTYQKSQINTPS